MKLSSRTIDILKNFSAINPTIPFTSGNVIRVANPSRTMMGEAAIEETFDRDFTIYDLNQFISILNTSKNPSLELKDRYAVINGEVEYWYADPRLSTIVKAKEVNLPSEDVSFDLKQDIFDRVIKAASIMSLPELSIASTKDNGITLNAKDSRSSTSNNISIPIPEGNANNHTFNIVLTMENMKLMHRDYRVIISTNRIVQFKSKQESSGLDLTYYIASLKQSVFNMKG